MGARSDAYEHALDVGADLLGDEAVLRVVVADVNAETLDEDLVHHRESRLRAQLRVRLRRHQHVLEENVVTVHIVQLHERGGGGLGEERSPRIRYRWPW